MYSHISVAHNYRDLWLNKIQQRRDKNGKYFIKRKTNIKIIYFILLNFILLGSLLYLIEKENFGNFKNILFTLFAFIFSICVFDLLTINKFNFAIGAIFSSIFFIIFYAIHQTKIRIKSNKFITILGDISYPSYLLHQMIYRDLYNLSNSHIATSIIFILICFLVYIFIEKPIINWLKKYSN